MAGPYHHPPLPPYLGSWALASLAFTSPIVLALLLTIIRLVLSINSANASIANAKQNLAASCTSLEQAASTAVSFPHYMAANFNNATADGAEAMIHGLGRLLGLSQMLRLMKLSRHRARSIAGRNRADHHIHRRYVPLNVSRL
jgi:hypothetical protein